MRVSLLTSSLGKISLLSLKPNMENMAGRLFLISFTSEAMAAKKHVPLVGGG